MSFNEVQFPPNISYGSRGGPGYNTNIVVTDGGSEERVGRWQSAKRQYDIRYAIKSPDLMAVVKDFYLAAQGALMGFRFKDWLDYDSTSTGHAYQGAVSSITNTDQQIGTGDGTTTQFQLIKRYTNGVQNVVRNITKPVAGTTIIALNGVNQTSGWTVDTTTGIVSFTSAPGSGVAVTAGFQFDVPVRFGVDADKVLMASHDDFGYGQLDPIPLVEIPDGTAVNDDAWCGGAVEICLTANYQLSAGYARGYVFEPQSSGLVVFLPDSTPSTFPTGGPFFYLMNAGPNSLTVKTYSGGSFITLAAGTGVDVILTVDGSNNKVWYAL